MTLYLYKTGTNTPAMTIENVTSYTDNEARTEEGAVYGPFAGDVELSSKPDCSEALRAEWRRAHCLADWPELMTREERQGVKLAALSAACSAAITAGMDVETSQGKEHFSLQETDQINLSTALSAVQAGAAGYPYHADKALCRLFTAEEIAALAKAATEHKLYHTTYYNHLAAWVRRCETAEELEAVTYGAALPEDLAASMTDILAAAGA